jgi:hypothetical protein
MASALDSNDKLYALGDRVFYKAQLKESGHYQPGDLLPGEIICRYQNGAHFTYRIRLDMKWSERVAASGTSIIVGNIHAGSIFSKSKK